MLDFSRFSHLTFDCYGTLIDWEQGIVEALQPVLRAHGVTLEDDRLLELFAEHEAAIEQGEYRSYRTVLQQVVRALGRRLKFPATEEDARALPQSMRNWQPFPDTVEALKKLAARYKLGVISNVDDDLFAHSARLLEVPFERVITAQQARSYKPSLNNFRLALRVLGAPPQRVLHVAQSLYHDIAPAKQLGLATVWVNRRKGKPGAGATPPAAAQPDMEVASLEELEKALSGTS